MIFFTSDLHFGHNNIIKHCNRPFSNADEMDDVLIKNWNKTITSKDSVWVLGDFCLNEKKINYYLEKLNGYKFLIKGNHDYLKNNNTYLWKEIYDVKEIKINKEKIWLSHYAHRVWPNSHYGSYHLFGHCHGKLESYRKSIDVGVDNWNFTPITFEEIKTNLSITGEINA